MELLLVRSSIQQPSFADLTVLRPPVTQTLPAAMDAGDDDPPVLLDRASRATRGKRITKLLEDEIEQDEVFWNQQALKDDVGCRPHSS